MAPCELKPVIENIINDGIESQFLVERQKGLQNILRSNVDIALASVYLLLLLATNSNSGHLLTAPDRSKN